MVQQKKLPPYYDETAKQIWLNGAENTHKFTL